MQGCEPFGVERGLDKLTGRDPAFHLVVEMGLSSM
jgi:hypothetical protein